MSIASVVLADNPVHFWEMQDASGSTLTDAVATPDDGTYVGGFTLAVAGPQNVIPDKAVTFNGSTGWATAPHTTDLNITGDLTLEMWVKPVNFNNYWFLITKATGNGTSATPYEWRIDAGDGILFFGNAGGSGNQSKRSDRPVVAGAWNHVAVVRASNVITHYLNGVANGSATFGAPNGNTLPVLIGSRPDASWSPTYAGAYAAVYNVALTAGQLLAHFNEAVANSLSAANISQLPVEVLQTDVPSDMRVSQLPIEVAEYFTPSDMRLTQLAVEVLWNEAASTGYKLAPSVS